MNEHEANCNPIHAEAAELAALLCHGILPAGAARTGGKGGCLERRRHVHRYGAGRNGDITLTVTIADGKITQIENVSNKETPKYWAEAVKLFDSILAANGTDGVDAVSGATLSSDGILEAVDDALAKASPQLSGSGTEADPYVISSAAQLQAFAALVDAGNTYAGQYVALGADIDLSGVDNWNPIGAEAKSDTLPRQALCRHVRRPRPHGLRAEDPGGGRCE